mmetsp:Transcript_14389/g.18064  ORF Transcript_14389/g.18064 Transcript_14389/m.18064 type:complete len:98 (-) Transcript_14389:62-355(-)
MASYAICLMNSCATFQAMMEEVLDPLLWQCVVVYIDDVFIFSNSFEEHLDHLDKVFTFYLRRLACEHVQIKLQYARHQSRFWDFTWMRKDSSLKKIR